MGYVNRYPGAAIMGRCPLSPPDSERPLTRMLKLRSLRWKLQQVPCGRAGSLPVEYYPVCLAAGSGRVAHVDPLTFGTRALNHG